MASRSWAGQGVAGWRLCDDERVRHFFLDVEVDTDRRELHRDGEEVRVEPKVFDVLAMLVENADRMLSKEELLDTLWGDRFVSESALSSRIKAARQAVGDNGRDQRIIRTIHGRGFRFIAEVSDSGAKATSEQVPNDVGTEQIAQQPQVLDNLPRRRDRLHGRSADLNRLSELVVSSDLISIVGTGGVGKTSLAIELGHKSTAIFPGGVLFCELARAGEGDVAGAIMGTLSDNAGTRSVTIREIAEALPESRSLVILDNCEHVIDEVAVLARDLVEQSSMVCVLATSREALDIRGEQVVRIEGLAYEGVNSPAVEMFFERANEVTQLPDTNVTRNTAREIITRLEGLPLAIELAVPRLVSSSPDELLSALDDQLTVLASRRRHGDRQSAMDRAIGWSFDLLTSDEQSMLCQLSVFKTPFTRVAVAAVVNNGDKADVLHRLVEQSVVSRVTAEATTRFRLLEPIRQFVERRLEAKDIGALEERHALHFASKVTTLAKELDTEHQPMAAGTLTEEWADFGRSLEWGRRHRNLEVAVDPLLALGFHLAWQQRIEGLKWLEEAHTMFGDLGEEGAREPRALILTGYSRWDGGERGAAMELLVEAEQYEVTLESRFLANYIEMTGDDFGALCEVTQTGWEFVSRRGDQFWLGPMAAYRLIGLGVSDANSADTIQATVEVDQLIEASDSTMTLCWGLLAHLTCAALKGDDDEARRLQQELHRVASECRAPWFSQIAGSLAARDPEVQDEIEQLEGALKSMSEMVERGVNSHFAFSFRAGVVALVRARQHVAAAQVTGVIEAFDHVGEIHKHLTRGYSDAVEAVTAVLGEVEQQRLVEIGGRMSPEQAVEIAEAALEVAAES